MTTRLEDNKISTVYAKALFEQANTNGQAEAVKDDVQSLGSLMSDVSGLQDFFMNPGVPKQDKHAFISKNFEGKLSPLVINLLKVMTENDRMSAFVQVGKRYQELLDRRDNVATAEVITADKLDAATAKRLEASLKDLFGYSRVNLESRVDPGILGGAVVKIEDKVIDGSYVGRLEALRKQLR